MAKRDSSGNLPERKGRKPKDSEFYEIPPDLREEFNNLMKGERKGEEEAPKFERATRSEIARQKFAKLSLLFALLGAVLLFVGPALAVGLGLKSRSLAAQASRKPAGPDLATFSIFLGAVMFVVNLVVVIVLATSK